MGNARAASWDIPCPAVRLGLTLALGLLGTWLFPGNTNDFPNPFAGVKGTAAFAWVTAALAAVGMLHVVERTRVPWTLYGLLSLAWALSWLFVLDGTNGIAWSFGIGLLLATGALASRLSLYRKSNSLLLASILRLPVLALLSPLILFTSRPAFSIFLIPFAAGYPLTLLGLFSYHSPAARFFFTTWTWLACSLLFLLSPWPGESRIRLTEGLPAARRVGPLGLFVLTAMALYPLATIAAKFFPGIISAAAHGKLFDRTLSLDAIWYGHEAAAKLFLLFALLTALTLPYVAAVRWVSDRSSWLGYWVFADSTALLSLSLLSILTPPFFFVLSYILTMGFTPKRMEALAFGLSGYAVILVFLIWAVRPPHNKQSSCQTGNDHHPRIKEVLS